FKLWGNSERKVTTPARKLADGAPGVPARPQGCPKTARVSSADAPLFADSAHAAASIYSHLLSCQCRSLGSNSPDFVIPTLSGAEGEGSAFCGELQIPSLRSG